jgi:hypothetical protein
MSATVAFETAGAAEDSATAGAAEDSAGVVVTVSSVMLFLPWSVTP